MIIGYLDPWGLICWFTISYNYHTTTQPGSSCRPATCCPGRLQYGEGDGDGPAAMQLQALEK